MNNAIGLKKAQHQPATLYLCLHSAKISISIGLKAQTQYSFSILIPLKKQVQTE